MSERASVDLTCLEFFCLLLAVMICGAFCDGRPGLTVTVNEQEYHVTFGKDAEPSAPQPDGGSSPAVPPQ